MNINIDLGAWNWVPVWISRVIVLPLWYRLQWRRERRTSAPYPRIRYHSYADRPASWGTRDDDVFAGVWREEDDSEWRRSRRFVYCVTDPSDIRLFGLEYARQAAILRGMRLIHKDRRFTELETYEIADTSTDKDKSQGEEHPDGADEKPSVAVEVPPQATSCLDEPEAAIEPVTEESDPDEYLF